MREITGEQLSKRVEAGTATLYGMGKVDYDLARREASRRNGQGTHTFSFVVYADEKYAVITLPVFEGN